MPRRCSVCTHAQRSVIESQLAGQIAYRTIADRFSVSKTALIRHAAEHLPAHLAKAEQAQEVAQATDIMAELQRCFHRVNLLFDACDRWLRDTEDPSRYDIGPRTEDVQVIYTETVAGKPVRRKARLSALLTRVEQGAGVTVEKGEYKHADPRTLVLKTAERLQGQTELLAKLLGELDERPVLNVVLAPEWPRLVAGLREVLAPHPAILAQVSAHLISMERESGHAG